MIDLDIDIFLTTSIMLIILVSSHSIFGIEVVKRGIIFTDLAIGQMASVGVALSILLKDDRNSITYSLIFATIGGILIYLISKKENREVFIALLYAIGISLVGYILHFTAHGNESLMKLLAGDILYISSGELLKNGLIYGSITIFWLFIKNKITNERISEIIFFILFGAIVSLSVKMVGVFVVFAILIAPPILAINIFKNSKVFTVLFISIPIGILAVFISIYLDISVGFSIIGVFAIFGLFSFLLQ